MDRLENTFKDKLGTYKSPVSDAVWQSVSASLHQEKKKRKFYFMFILIGLLLISILTGIYFYNKPKDTNIQLNQKDINVAQHNNNTSPNAQINSINKSISLNDSQLVNSSYREIESNNFSGNNKIEKDQDNNSFKFVSSNSKLNLINNSNTYYVEDSKRRSIR